VPLAFLVDYSHKSSVVGQFKVIWKIEVLVVFVFNQVVMG
jgi:hypothetical protein